MATSNSTIIILLFIILIILTSISITINILRSNINKEAKYRINLLEKDNKLLNEKILDEKERLLIVSDEYFKKGFEEGIRKNNFTIRVDPIENNIGKDYWIFSSEKIEIGYKYTLMNNDIPSEFTTTHFTKVISKSRIKEENINTVLETINQIQNLNPNTFIINKSFENIKNNLIKQLIKK